MADRLLKITYQQRRFYFILSRTSSISRYISCPSNQPVILFLFYPSKGLHVPSFSWPCDIFVHPSSLSPPSVEFVMMTSQVAGFVVD